MLAGLTVACPPVRLDTWSGQLGIPALQEIGTSIARLELVVQSTPHQLSQALKTIASCPNLRNLTFTCAPHSCTRRRDKHPIQPWPLGLRLLHLHTLQIIPTFPTAFTGFLLSSCPNLEYLDLENPQYDIRNGHRPAQTIYGSRPYAKQTLPNLRSLNIGRCSLEWVNEQFTTRRSLKLAELSAVFSAENELSEIVNMQSMRRLHITVTSPFSDDSMCVAYNLRFFILTFFDIR